MKLSPIRAAVALLAAFAAVVPVSLQAQQEPHEFRLRYPGLQVTGPQPGPENGSPSGPLLQLSTKLVDFGDVATNTTETRQVLVSNEGTAGLRFTAAPAVTGHGAFGAGVTTCGTTLAAGADCLTNVTFSPTAIGAAEGLLTFSTPLVDSPHGVTLKGTAYNPVSLKTATLPDSTVGAAFSYDFKPLLEVSNESSPEKGSATWLVTSGNVPAGLQLDSATGVLSGVPSAANTGAGFSVAATYKKNEARHDYVLKVSLAVASFGGYRAWSDGSVASSCYQYRVPAVGKTYSGSVGDGVYRIQPPGQGATNVYCDMTRDGGGWTLVVKAQQNSNAHANSAAVGTLTGPNQATVAKFSDAFINAIPKTMYRMSNSSGTGAVYFDTSDSFASTRQVNNKASKTWSSPVWEGPFLDPMHRGLNTYQPPNGNFGRADPVYGNYTGTSSSDACRLGMGVGGGVAGWCGAGDAGTVWTR